MATSLPLFDATSLAAHAQIRMSKPGPITRGLTRRDASKRAQILGFFCQRIRRSFRTDDLHAWFGTAFSTPVSELNRDPTCPITIHNHIEHLPDGAESSCYRAKWNSPQWSLFPGFLCDQAPERHRDDG